jgi:N-acetyl sugar amidotransferase
MQNERVCSRCVMDTSATEIAFDERGVCSFCHDFDRRIEPELRRVLTPEGATRFRIAIDTIRQVGRGRKHDSLLGLSGGTDSSYLAHVAVQNGLKPLAVHVDMGWNTPLSEANVKAVADALKLDLEVVKVDWEPMREIQLAFYRAGLKNCEIPQDHVYLAVLYRVAQKHGLRYYLSGGNSATESVLPRSWGYNAADVRHLRAVHKRFGHGTLRGLPTLPFWRRYVYYRYILPVREVRLLNLVPYNQREAKELLEREVGWRNYGAKHYESVLTRFYQGHYLPTRFGIDKRKAHLSSLVLSGQLTRAEALAELAQPAYSEGQLSEDTASIAKTLAISVDEWKALVNSPIHQHDEFPSERWLFALKDSVATVARTRSRRR